MTCASDDDIKLLEHIQFSLPGEWNPDKLNNRDADDDWSFNTDYEKNGKLNEDSNISYNSTTTVKKTKDYSEYRKYFAWKPSLVMEACCSDPLTHARH